MSGAGGDAGAVDRHASAPAAAVATAQTITLITGDRILLDRSQSGRHAITVEPSEPTEVDSGFDVIEENGQVYVIPSDAVHLVSGVLDRELFNVTKLAEFGYTDGIPVIVSHADIGVRQSTASPGITVSTSLSSIAATAATIAPDGEWWRAVIGDGDSGPPQLTATSPLADVERVWLDELVEAALDESVPQIGAPAAWDAGYDGTGVRVAVLDTGIDADHPDLAGKVIAEANFTTSDTTGDRHGHGTHVAGTVAGSGAASDGALTGAAPGVELLNGKVLGDGGSGPLSAVIAGMQWATAQGADIVNLSLGSSPTDGTDPVSQAVNQLTAQHDALFVVAAGNTGGLGDHTIDAPGAADAALTVGAVDKADELAGFSGRGPRRGDKAIKPDVTAPGVGIVAARAAGSQLGLPVGDRYMRLSGTSMATPHVAGAAAILLQQDPDLGAADLKASLATTAVPHPDLDVYQQGGGRIDVVAALDNPVRATPASLSLGSFEFPQDDAVPVDAEVTYLNRSDEPVTLDLSLQVASRDGHVPPAAMLSVEPDTVTLEPGELATAVVTVDVSEGEFGLYGGYLVAERGGEVLTRTAVGFYKEAEPVTLTVEAIARDGRAAVSPSSVDVINVDDYLAFSAPVVAFTGQPLSFRVPPGTYSVIGRIFTHDARNQFLQDLSFVGEPNIELAEDRTLVLDARTASPIVTDTPDHDTAPHPPQGKGGYVRISENGGGLGVLSFYPQALGWYVAGSDPVTAGEFEFLNAWRLGRPELTISVSEPVELKLDTYLHSAAPRIDVDGTFPLVYAGLGRPEDFDGIEADGAVVLTRRGETGLLSKAVNAAAAGAVAVVIANDIPGSLIIGIGNPGIPVVTAPMEDGDALLELLADGDVTVHMVGSASTPYLYELVHVDPDRMPTEPHYVVRAGDLATVEADYHTDIDGHEIGELRHMFRPSLTASIGNYTLRPGPIRRTEYLTPGDTTWRQQFIPAWAAGVTDITAPDVQYEAGQQLRETWNRGPARPTVYEGGPLQQGIPVLRVGDTLTLRLAEWTDAHPGHWVFAGTLDGTAFRLYRNGELTAAVPRPTGSFPLSLDPATYRLELDVARDAAWWLTSTATHTAWTVHSARGIGSQVLPILLVEYDVELDLLNTAPHPRDRNGPPAIQVSVRHQRGADGPPVAGARLWTSYDDGGSWRARAARRLDDGRFEFRLDARDPVDTSGYLSLRVEAWDADGNRIEQEIIRAWRLPPR